LWAFALLCWTKTNIGQGVIQPAALHDRSPNGAAEQRDAGKPTGLGASRAYGDHSAGIEPSAQGLR